MQVQQKNDISVSDFGPKCTEVMLDLNNLYAKYNGKVDGGVLMAAYLFFGVAILNEAKLPFKSIPLYKKVSLRIIMWLHAIFMEALKQKDKGNDK